MTNRAINLPIKQNNQLNQINQLEADKQRIEGLIYRLENQLQTEIDPNIDEADPGLTSQVITQALLDNARQEAEAIERALSQVQAGRYGLCEDCEQPIDPERLEIFPQATRCVACKAAHENLDRRPRYRLA